jgi:hypothetical protein
MRTLYRIRRVERLRIKLLVTVSVVSVTEKLTDSCEITEIKSEMSRSQSLIYLHHQTRINGERSNCNRWITGAHGDAASCFLVEPRQKPVPNYLIIRHESK